MLHHQATLFPGRWERTDPWGLTFYWNHRYCSFGGFIKRDQPHSHLHPSPHATVTIYESLGTRDYVNARVILLTLRVFACPPPTHPPSKLSTLMHSLLPLRAVFSLGILPFPDLPVVFRTGYQCHEVLGKNMSQERFEHRTYPTFTIMCISSRNRSNISKTPNCNKT